MSVGVGELYRLAKMDRGFVHIEDAFTRKSIDILHDAFTTIDFEEDAIKFQYVGYDEKSGSITRPTTPDGRLIFQGLETESLRDHFKAYNFHVNSQGRTVIQLYNEKQNPDLQVSEERLPDGNLLGRVLSTSTMDYVARFFAKNKQLIENLVTRNKKLYQYFREYPVHEYTKLFLNEPGCANQEVHCDKPVEDTRRNTMYVVIPLNDCDEDMGTTIFYDNALVAKYFTGEDAWFNRGNVENFGNEMKKDFETAEYNVPFKAGNAILFFGDSIHRGTRNISSKTRVFLHMAWRKT